MNLQSICGDVITESKKIGYYLKRERNQFQHTLIEVKGRNDFVSYVDKNAEKQFGKSLLNILPEAGFIGEEGELQIDNKSINWIVDPLDGTTNYIHGIPFYSTSVALMKEKELLIAVVYLPEIDECFSAFKGGGAFLNEEKIHVSKTSILKESLLATGFPYTNFDFARSYIGLFEELMHQSRGIRRIGSAAIDLAYTACGRFDSFFEYGLNPWDVAAGSLIVQEAGGRVSDFFGGDDFVFGGSIVSSNSFVHSEVLKATSHHFSI
ncbi:MAG: inositol monophosphatase family protein [Bacteroidota bacterium]